MCLCAFRLTNQKRVCPRALATQPIKSYFANPILKKEIGGARTRHFCHNVTAWLKPVAFPFWKLEMDLKKERIQLICILCIYVFSPTIILAIRCFCLMIITCQIIMRSTISFYG